MRKTAKVPWYCTACKATQDFEVKDGKWKCSRCGTEGIQKGRPSRRGPGACGNQA